jgi:hypothetical protein
MSLMSIFGGAGTGMTGRLPFGWQRRIARG